MTVVEQLAFDLLPACGRGLLVDGLNVDSHGRAAILHAVELVVAQVRMAQFEPRAGVRTGETPAAWISKDELA